MYFRRGVIEVLRLSGRFSFRIQFSDGIFELFLEQFEGFFYVIFVVIRVFCLFSRGLDFYFQYIFVFFQIWVLLCQEFRGLMCRGWNCIFYVLKMCVWISLNSFLQKFVVFSGYKGSRWSNCKRIILIVRSESLKYFLEGRQFLVLARC